MVYIDRFEGKGIGPEIIAPVDFAVFTIFFNGYCTFITHILFTDFIVCE